VVDKKSIWKSKDFLAGSGAAAIGMVLLLLTLIQPLVVENTYAIGENAVNIGKIIQTLENVDSSIDEFNDNYETLDDKLDKMSLILCDMSDGKHCS